MSTGLNSHHAALQVEYDGAPFHGWARQPDVVSVEGCLRDAAAAVALDVTSLQVAGRTDAGVHADAQVVSLGYVGPVPADRLAPALRRGLPPEISVVRSAPIADTFDARAHARWREYRYRVLPRRARSPLRATRVLHHPRTLDLATLNRAVAGLVGTHDFTAFTPSNGGHKHFRRTVLHARWSQVEDEVHLQIRARSFLRNMVRVLVGTMLAVGRGDMDLEQFHDLLHGSPRQDAFNTAPAHALTLHGVGYDHDPFDGDLDNERWQAGSGHDLG